MEDEWCMQLIYTFRTQVVCLLLRGVTCRVGCVEGSSPKKLWVWVSNPRGSLCSLIWTFSALWESYKYKNMDKITQKLENVVICKYFEAGVHIKNPIKNSYQDGLLGRTTQTLDHVVVVHILIWDKRESQINEYLDVGIIDWLRASKFGPKEFTLGSKFRMWKFGVVLNSNVASLKKKTLHPKWGIKL